jgi:hypothetical protein
MVDAILESVIDSVKLLPFLFGAYLLIEYIEHRASDKLSKILSDQNRFGAVIGAVLGCIPQCGFSVAASNLYARRVISIGTLIAVFVSTSDEAIPVLLASPNNFQIMLKLIILKVLIAIIAGLLLDIILKKFSVKKPSKDHNEITEELCVHCHCERGIFKAALFHTINIFIFILLVNVFLNLIIYLIGEDKLSTILLSDSILQPAIAALIGLIPNCAASVVLTQLFIEGSISFGSVVAGLSTGAGLGLLILFKENKDMKENIKITAFLYIVGTVSGIIIQLLN